MARPIYRLQPFNTSPDVAIGIKLPFNKAAAGFSETLNYASGSLDGGSVFVQSYTTLEQVVSNIKSLLLTRKGERFMQPNLGTDINDYLFENLSNDAISDLESSIIDDFAFWLPYVSLEDLQVVADRVTGTLAIRFDVVVTTLRANIQINVLIDSDQQILAIDTEVTDAVGTVGELVPISSAPISLGY